MLREAPHQLVVFVLGRVPSYSSHGCGVITCHFWVDVVTG